jgi:hypothetical protein
MLCHERRVSPAARHALIGQHGVMGKREWWWHATSKRTAAWMIAIYLTGAVLCFLLGLVEHSLWVVAVLSVALAASWIPQLRRAGRRERIGP